jgi:uncharacterized membrane-anchored protein
MKRPLLNFANSKVPEITTAFWITKILTTGMGETTSDFFAKRFDPILVVLITGVALLTVLIVQLRAQRYIPWLYWLTVVMVSVFGTMAADVLHVGLGIPYIVSTSFYAIVLAILFILWYRSENTLSIHSIHTTRRELFYWATVLATFALGTAAGDLTATTFGLGYLSSGILFAIVIAIPAITYWKLSMNEIVAFWFAYILTRPLGASFSDWGAVAQSRGGLGLGSGPISLSLGILIIVLVEYLTITHRSSRSMRYQ